MTDNDTVTLAIRPGSMEVRALVASAVGTSDGDPITALERLLGAALLLAARENMPEDFLYSIVTETYPLILGALQAQQEAVETPPPDQMN